VKLASGKTLTWLIPFSGPRLRPVRTFGPVAKTASLFTITSGKPQKYASADISCGLFEDESSAILLSKSKAITNCEDEGVSVSFERVIGGNHISLLPASL
jgi:hypothetical protein